MWLKNPENWVGWFYLIPLFVLIILFTILPIIQSMQGAFETHPYRNKLTITKIGLDNFKWVWKDNNFWVAIKNSTIILFVATFISFIISFFVAFLIESFILKVARSAFLTVFYSQFFLSSFAVGIAFVLLFGEKNVFFKLFAQNKFSFTSGKTHIVWYFVLFQVWRSLPFNIILFAAAINKANLKYKKLMQTDNLKTWSKIKYVYFQELKVTIFSITITNFIFAFLLYPNAILESTFNYEKHQAFTVSSYILRFLGIGDGEGFYYNISRAYASSMLIFAYAILLMLFVYLFRIKNLKRVYKFLKYFKTKLIRKKYVEINN
ncbi:sugar ABC transporter permease [Mycoplasma zalophi]|uniref:carbohydrate ABC transporter permease n=1 Tax=Mycoplasma zalophi TaxID=191287 RepID=UPI0021C82B65|nr:sugar ABC transporter permease [Mycoplasma zalophi]MCU4117202.1 sugar ABC transporter permease [Mycoplasma zalophi]